MIAAADSQIEALGRDEAGLTNCFVEEANEGFFDSGGIAFKKKILGDQLYYTSTKLS